MTIKSKKSNYCRELSLQRLPNTISPSEKDLFLSILESNTSFIKNDVLEQRNAHLSLFKKEMDFSDAELIWHKILVQDKHSDSSLKSISKSNVKMLLTKEEEILIFLQMNYAKRVVDTLKSEFLSGRNLSLREYRKIFVWHQIANQRRNSIVVANLGIVFAVGKKLEVLTHPEFKTMQSEMEIDLIRSVNAFNIIYGFKFSTYAFSALYHKVFKVLKSYNNYNQKFVSFSLSLPNAEENSTDKYLDPVMDDIVNKVSHNEDIETLDMCIKYNWASLTPKELDIVRLRYGVDYPDSYTLKEVGRVYKLSAERIRQIEKKAMKKIKEVLVIN